MGAKSTLVLAGLAVGLGVAFVLLDEKPQEAEDQNDVVAPLLTRSMRDAVALELVPGADAQPLELRRGAVGSWELVEPIRDRASAAVLESIAGAFGAAKATLDLPPEQVTDDALSQRGLAKPEAKLKFVFDGGDEVAFQFGQSALSANEVYLLRSDRDGVWRCPGHLKTTLTSRNRDSMRDRRIVRHDASGIRTLEVRRVVEGVEQRTEVRIVGREIQVLLDGVQYRASLGAAQELLSRIAGLRIAGFPTGLGDQGDSLLSVKIDGTLGSESFDVWLDGQAYLGRSEGRVSWLGLDARDVEPLLLFDADSLRARALWTRPIDRAERVGIRRLKVEDKSVVDGSELAFGRVLGALELQQPIRSKADGVAVADLVSGLREFSGSSFVEDARSLDDVELAGEILEFELWFGRRSTDREVVRLARDSRGSLLAERVGDDQVVRLQTSVYEAVARTWPDYVDRNVFRTTSPSKVRGFSVTRGGAEARADRDPVTGLFEPDRIDELVDELLDLDAEEVADVSRIADSDPDYVVRLLGVRDFVLLDLSVHRVEGRFWCVRPDRPQLCYRIRTRLGEDLRELGR